LFGFALAMEKLPREMVVVEDLGAEEHIRGCRRGL
jgi:hypothetical protein